MERESSGRMSADAKYGAFSAGTSVCSAVGVGASVTDPEFGPKAADVVGLYLNPPGKRTGASGRREAVHAGLATGLRLFAASRWPRRQWV